MEGKEVSKLTSHLQTLDRRDDDYRALVVALRKEAEAEQRHEGEWPPRVRMLNAAATAIAVLLGDEPYASDSPVVEHKAPACAACPHAPHACNCFDPDLFPVEGAVVETYDRYDDGCPDCGGQYSDLAGHRAHAHAVVETEGREKTPRVGLEMNRWLTPDKPTEGPETPAR